MYTSEYLDSQQNARHRQEFRKCTPQKRHDPLPVQIASDCLLPIFFPSLFLSSKKDYSGHVVKEALEGRTRAAWIYLEGECKFGNLLLAAGISRAEDTLWEWKSGEPSTPPGSPGNKAPTAWAHAGCAETTQLLGLRGLSV